MITMTDFLSLNTTSQVHNSSDVPHHHTPSGQNPTTLTKVDRKQGNSYVQSSSIKESDPECMVTTEAPSSSSSRQQLVLPLEDGPMTSFTAADQGIVGVTSHPECTNDASTLVLDSPRSGSQSTASGSMLLVSSLPQTQTIPASPSVLSHSRVGYAFTRFHLTDYSSKQSTPLLKSSRLLSS